MDSLDLNNSKSVLFTYKKNLNWYLYFCIFQNLLNSAKLGLINLTFVPRFVRTFNEMSQDDTNSTKNAIHFFSVLSTYFQFTGQKLAMYL